MKKVLCIIKRLTVVGMRTNQLNYKLNAKFHLTNFTSLICNLQNILHKSTHGGPGPLNGVSLSHLRGAFPFSPTTLSISRTLEKEAASGLANEHINIIISELISRIYPFPFSILRVGVR
jgi:hypothetical protein